MSEYAQSFSIFCRAVKRQRKECYINRRSLSVAECVVVARDFRSVLLPETGEREAERRNDRRLQSLNRQNGALHLTPRLTRRHFTRFYHSISLIILLYFFVISRVMSVINCVWRVCRPRRRRPF